MVAKYTGKDAWANAVAHEVGPGVTIKSLPGLFTVMLPCTVCHQTKEYDIPRKYPPTVLRKKLEEFGWRTGKHLSCPNCVKTRPNAHKRIRYDELPQTSMVAVAAASPKAEPEVAKAHAAKAPPSAPPRLPASQDELAKVNSLEDLSKLVPPGWLNGAKPAEPERPVPTEFKRPKILPGKPAAPVSKPAPAHAPAAQPQQAAKPGPTPSPEPVAPAAPAAPAPAAASPPSTPAVPTPAARQAHQKMYELLTAWFDHDQGLYRADSKGYYTDERVARESGAHLQHVREERDTWFGPLRPPSELTLMQARADKLEKELRAFEESARAVAEQMRGKLQELRQELVAMCRRNGWG